MTITMNIMDRPYSRFHHMDRYGSSVAAGQDGRVNLAAEANHPSTKKKYHPTSATLVVVREFVADALTSVTRGSVFIFATWILFFGTTSSILYIPYYYVASVIILVGAIGSVAAIVNWFRMVPLSKFESNKNIGKKGSKKSVAPISELNMLAIERESRGEPVYNFAAGNPSLEPPKEILTELINLAGTTNVMDERNETSCAFKYTHPAGLTSLRKFIADEVGEWQCMPPSSSLSAENVVMTCGAQSAIVNVFEALLRPGDHVLVQTPFYPCYDTSAELWGATTKKIKFLEGTGDSSSSFDIDINHLREKFGRDVWILMDGTYWRLTFNNNQQESAGYGRSQQGQVPPIFPFYKQSILLSSFSKDLSLAGERLGYVVVHPKANHSKDLVRWITNTNDRLGNISPPSLIHSKIKIYHCALMVGLVDHFRNARVAPALNSSVLG